MCNKKNILVLSPDTPVASMGGLGVHLSHLIRLISKEKYSVCVVCFGGNYDTFIDGVRVVSADTNPIRTFGIDGCDMLKIMAAQTSLVQCAYRLMLGGFKPDVIYSMDWTTALAAMQLSKAENVPMIFAVHLSVNCAYSDKMFGSESYDYACNIEIEACNEAVRILHVSKSYVESFPFVAFANKSAVIPNGVDSRMFDNARTDYFDKDEYKGRKTILFLGRLADMKQPTLLLNLDLNGMNLVYVGGGSGSDDNLVAAVKAASKACGNIFYLGQKFGSEKADIMASADMVVMPSRHEPFGLVALEAMLAGVRGKTILCSSFAGGMAEFLTEDCALFCGTNKDSIQRAIDRFDAMSESDKRSMRASAIDVCSRYTWENTIKLIENEIDHATGN